MKEIFVAFSRYNQGANAAVYSQVATMGADRLTLPIKAFYPTIVDTLFHTMRSDIKWLHRLSAFLPSPVPADASAAYMSGDRVDPALAARDVRGFIELRTRVDAAIIATIAAVPEEAFGRDIEIEFGPKRITRPLWQLLLQWFNHQTHHRGQASVQLDALGIDNDFSGMLDKIG